MIEICEACREGPAGEDGHPDLAFLMAGPFPAHQTRVCMCCGETWVRYWRCFGRFGWIRYSHQFPLRNEPEAVGRAVPRRPTRGPTLRPLQTRPA